MNSKLTIKSARKEFDVDILLDFDEIGFLEIRLPDMTFSPGELKQVAKEVVRYVQKCRYEDGGKLG